MIDACIYGDTDSVYISVGTLIGKYINEDKWNTLSDDQKVDYIDKIANVVAEYVNEKAFTELQQDTYNSPIEDMRIFYEQEVIAKTFVIAAKKKYGMFILSDDGHRVEKPKVKGLEIVQGSTPIAIKPMLTDILMMILKGYPDHEIKERIGKYKRELKSVYPEEIAINISANNQHKYLKTGQPIKGTPAQVKGVYNYRLLLKELKIENKYEDIFDGARVKMVYLKKNPFGIDNISFVDRWPKEFNDVVQIDYGKQIKKHFEKKIESIFKAINKVDLLKEDNSSLLDMLM